MNLDNDNDGNLVPPGWDEPFSAEAHDAADRIESDYPVQQWALRAFDAGVAVGVAAGRKQAAAEIAAKFRGIVSRCDHDPKLQRAYEMAALVAEETNHAD